MQGGTLNWNKENNLNLNNTRRRKHNLKTLTLTRPSTPLFQATFNPFPPKNGFSIPLISSKHPEPVFDITSDDQERQSLIRPSLKQKPIIARSNKLKDFFAHKSARYVEGCHQDQKNERIRGRSLNALSIRRESIQQLALLKDSRKQQFERIYLRQKEAYQKILSKQGVLQTIVDEDFNRFMFID